MRIVWALGFLILFSGCTSVIIHVPLAEVTPSEMMKQSSWQVGVNSKATHLYTATNDASARPPTFVDGDSKSSLISADIAFAPLDLLQLSAGLTGDSGLYGSVAYQFVGSSWQEKKIGWSAAAHLDLQVGSTNKSGDQNGQFGAGGYKWNASLGMSAIGGGASVGYRFHESVLTFLGASKLKHSVKLNISHDPSDNGVDPGASYTRNFDGSSSSVGLGVMLGEGSFRVVPVVQWVDYELGNTRASEATINASLEFGGF